MDTLPHQRQYGLRKLVRLRDHRRTGLHQNLKARKVQHFQGHVRVPYAAFSVGQVRAGHRQICDGMLKPVLVTLVFLLG